jgi:hypothetical protein
LQAGNSDFTALAVACRTAALDVRRTSTRAEVSQWSIAIISIEMPGMSEGLARADALLQPAQTPGAATPPEMYQPAAWVSYTGGEAMLLAIVLLVVAGGFAYAGKRLRAPLKITPPGSPAAGFMIAIWLLAIYTVNAVSAASIPAAIPGRALNDIAADVAAFDAGDRVCRLRGGGDVSRIRRVGCVRVRLSRGTATARAEHHLEDPVLRSGDHAVCLEEGQGSLWSRA